MPDELPDECCAKCRFLWDPATVNPWECRRFPPVITHERYFVFPDVDDDDWCGEFQPRKETP